MILDAIRHLSWALQWSVVEGRGDGKRAALGSSTRSLQTTVAQGQGQDQQDKGQGQDQDQQYQEKIKTGRTKTGKSEVDSPQNL